MSAQENLLCLGQPGFQHLLGEELTTFEATSGHSGPGWVLAQMPEGRQLALGTVDVAFPHLVLIRPTELKGESVNGLANALIDYLLESLRGERIETAWPCFFDGPAEIVGLGRRISGVEKAFYDALRKRLSRVARLATAERLIGMGAARGLFVWFCDFGRLYVSRDAFYNGPRRMADDPLAPSRSYLKVEEAYSVLGLEPRSGETVYDLGAAPGGWSYSAAKRGARVIAIDNGPLKGGALGHPLIEHRREDAFRVQPPDGQPCDWLFCDMVEEPHHVMRNIVEPWLARGWCRRFIVNLKFGRVDPISLLAELRAPTSPFVAHCVSYHIRHLFHDREEFTVVGILR
jgi:23S rRNA (cytidine2498-2'-O)-methyltransferase